MSPKGGKKAQKAARSLRTSPVVDPQHLPTRSPLDDGAMSQMFNLSAPHRKGTGGPPLNPGLPEHTPKKRRTKEPVLSTEGHQFDPNLGSRLEQAVDDRHRQIMSAQAPLKERIEYESAKGSDHQEGNNGSANDDCAKGAANDEDAKGAGNEESAKGAANKESDKGSDNNDVSTKLRNSVGFDDESKEVLSYLECGREGKSRAGLFQATQHFGVGLA
jgi:hypothetical protein